MPANRNSTFYKFIFLFVDLVALNCVHAVVLFALIKTTSETEKPYLFLFIAANACWLTSAYATALYLDQIVQDEDNFSKNTIKTFAGFNVLLLFFMFVYHFPFSRLFMGLSFAIFLVYLIISRIAVAGFSHYIKKTSKENKRIVILGYNEVAKKLVDRFATHRKNYVVAGYFENKNVVKELSNLPIIGEVENCIEYAKNNNINEIYSTISPERNSQLYLMAQQAERALIRFKFVPDFRLYVNRNFHMEYFSDIPIISLRPQPLDDIGNAIKKRLLDVALSSVIIVFVLSWLIPIIGLIIRLDSKGSIFFVQLRSGRNNTEFNCYKFRTLRRNDGDNNKQVTINDDRVTKVGRFLRKTNLDELPQFINVIFGTMTIVGPRPHMLSHTTEFSKITEEYMLRHFLKPGVTGWAQVHGYRGEIKQDDQLRKRIEYDIWYMENWSIWLDLKIIWLTIYTTLKGDSNAY